LAISSANRVGVKAQIFFAASLPGQDIEPGLGQSVGEPGALAGPGVPLRDLAGQHAPQWRVIIPTLLGRSHRRIKGVIDAIIVNLCLPVNQLVRPVLAFLAGQLGGEQGLGPGRPEVGEKGAGVAVGIVQVYPAGYVLLGDSLENGFNSIFPCNICGGISSSYCS
jgi:hypothetical protein